MKAIRFIRDPVPFLPCIPHVRVFRSVNRESRRYPGLPFRYRYSAGCQVSGPGYLAPGTRYRINAEGRTPSTEDRAKRAHRVCILHPRRPAPRSSPDCLTASLPHCPTARLPYCLTASLPYCRTAVLPHWTHLLKHSPSWPIQDSHSVPNCGRKSDSVKMESHRMTEE